jgi:protein-tyrosine phosphatase
MTATTIGGYWIALEGAVNARAVVPGVLLRSDNLQGLTAGDVRLLIDRELVKVVLDLRTDVEVQLEGPGPMTRESGVCIEHRSLYPDSGGNTDFEVDAVRPWQRPHGGELSREPAIVRAYLSYLRRRPDSVTGAVETIARADGAVLVHCAAGKDRTGVVVALALDAVGVDREVIVGDYAASAERIEEIMGRLVSSPTYRPQLEGHDPRHHAPLPVTMERFLELVDDHLGGSARWLLDHGLSPGDLDRLGGRLVGAARPHPAQAAQDQ